MSLPDSEHEISTDYICLVSHNQTVTAWKHSPPCGGLDTHLPGESVQKDLKELLTIHTVSHISLDSTSRERILTLKGDEATMF